MTTVDLAVVEDFSINWFLNVWDEIGEETTKQDIVNDFASVLGNEAETFVDAWFEDHAKLLQAYTQAPHPALSIINYEQAVRDWIEKQLDKQGLI